LDQDEELRNQQRLAFEDLDFNPEHYQADYFLKQEFQFVFDFKPESHKALKRIQQARKELLVISMEDDFLKMNALENQEMMQLPNKSCKS
jgi:hypothetical protein